jgi:uncharacterized coiled-coil DUF342 family protein
MAEQSSAKQEYQKKVQANLHKINAQIDELKAKSSQVKADMAIEYHSKLEELYIQRDAVKAKFEEMQQSGEEAWNDLQTGFENAWQELNTSFESAVSKFFN